MAHEVLLQWLLLDIIVNLRLLLLGIIVMALFVLLLRCQFSMVLFIFSDGMIVSSKEFMIKLMTFDQSSKFSSSNAINSYHIG